jgi:hypothetical protein
MNQSEKFIVITTTMTYRKRYAIPADDAVLKDDEGNFVPEFAIGVVGKGEAKYCSLREVGEQILDAQIVDQGVMLNMFNSDNPDVEATEEERIAFLKDWVARAPEETND